MKAIWILLLYLSLSTLLTGCKRIVDAKEYLMISNDKSGPLAVEVLQAGYSFVCYYRSPDYELAKGIVKGSELHTFPARRENYSNFVIECKVINSNVQAERKMDPQKLLYNLASNFTVVSENKNKKCQLAFYEYDSMSKTYRILITTSKIEEKNFNKSLIRMKDWGLNCGTVDFHLTKINTSKVKLRKK